MSSAFKPLAASKIMPIILSFFAAFSSTGGEMGALSFLGEDLLPFVGDEEGSCLTGEVEVEDVWRGGGVL